MAGLSKIRTKKGEVRYRVQWRGRDGRGHEKWARTLAEARSLKAQIEADAIAGLTLDPRAGSQRLDDYFAGWLSTRLARGRPLAPSTVSGYRGVWARNIRPQLGNLQLRAIRSETVRTWYAAVIGVAGRDQAAKSYRLLRAVLATAETDEHIRSNPCRIRGGGQEQHDERPLVDTSVVIRLAELIEPRYKSLILLAGLAGLRTGESLGLCRRDVDILHSTVEVVVQAQEVVGAGRVLLPPKSDAGRRKVAVPEIVRDALAEHLGRYTSRDNDSPVFTGPSGGPLRRATLSSAWRIARAHAGCPSTLRLHDLRHHAATMTARTPGVTTKELMARIGHSSPRAALIYQHATEGRDRAIAEFMDEVVAKAQATSATAEERGGVLIRLPPR
jgi:integrase